MGQEDRMSHEQYVQSKNSEKKTSIFPWILLTFIILFVGIGLIFMYMANNHSYFNLDIVTINGNTALSDEDIIQAMDLGDNPNIFKTETSVLESKVLSLEGIEKVEISKYMPDRLVVEVVEDVDFAFITVEDGYLIINGSMLIDRHVHEITEEMNDKLIRVSNASYDSLSIGQSISNDNDEINFLSKLLNHQLFTIIQEVDFGESFDNVKMTTEGGLKISFGTLDESDYKFSIIENIIDDLNKKGIRAEEIILDAGQNPIIVRKN